MASVVLARVEVLASDPTAAERVLRGAYESLVAVEERYLRPSVAALLAELLVGQGRVDEADELTREAEELGAPDDVDAQSLWRLARAAVLMWRDDVEQAEALVREALDLLEPTDVVVNRVSGWSRLAEILFRTGRPDEGRALLDEARELVTRKGSVVMLGQLGELESKLAQLSYVTPETA